MPIPPVRTNRTVSVAVSASAAIFSQVVYLSNALRHTPAGGTVTIASTPADEAVSITVTDTGDVIAAEHLPHIFDRFYRCDPSRARTSAGSGAGLTITRGIAEAHSGTLTATSPGPGRGSRFTMTIPRAD
ncbi:sensor histidine kinase [Tsukamurella soli]|uniref:sensor histidine kinase n=1 Tax=Tsukamurella soli TaxID=644556 RepID=UPI0036154A07